MQKLFDLAMKELGQKEIYGKKHNARIIEFLQSVSKKFLEDEIAWCACFINWLLAQLGIKGTGSGLASSFGKWGFSVDIGVPYPLDLRKHKPATLGDAQRGDVVWLGRTTNPENLNHVAIFDRYEKGVLYVLGGNQGNSVSVSDKYFYIKGVRRIEMSGAKRPSEPKPVVVPATSVPKEVALAFKKRQELADLNLRGGKCNWIFEEHMHINASKPRLFVYSIRDKKLYKYKAAHGRGGLNDDKRDGECRQFSNTPGSHMSSLGYILTGDKFNSDVTGWSIRCYGLSPTNTQIDERGCHIHGGEYVKDNESGTNREVPGFSLGCIVTALIYIDRKKGGELLDWLKDGSVGCAHYDGKFFTGSVSKRVGEVDA